VNLSGNGAIAFALGAALLFGLALVLTQPGLRYLPPRLAALVSVPASTALLWLLSPLVVDWQGWNPRAALIFAGVGLLFPATVTLLTFESNRRMGPNVAGALGNLTPLFAVLLAVALFGETPRLIQGAGIAAIVIGVGALSLDRRWLGAPWPYWAALFPLGAAAIRGIIQPVTKLGLALWPSAFAAVLIGYSVSCLVIAGAALLRGGAGMSAGPVPRAGLAWFVGVGLCNGGAVLALYAALTRGSVMLVSPLVATYPLVTLALVALFLRSARIGARQIGGVALTVLGAVVLVASR
jgi:drug/metabolite transporter (DMT)-like permease